MTLFSCKINGYEIEAVDFGGGCFGIRVTGGERTKTKLAADKWEMVSNYLAACKAFRNDPVVVDADDADRIARAGYSILGVHANA